MATLVLRNSKGSPLTFAEVDANFTNLNNELATKTTSGSIVNADISTSAAIAGTKISYGVTAVAALNIDCSLGNYFTKTISGDSTFTVSNVPSNISYAFALELTHTSGNITWFSGVVWPEDAAPTLTTGNVHLFVFHTDDGGTKWRGSVNANYAS